MLTLLTVWYHHVTPEFQSETTLYSLAKWLGVCLQTKWLWVRILLLSRTVLISKCSTRHAFKNALLEFSFKLLKNTYKWNHFRLTLHASNEKWSLKICLENDIWFLLLKEKTRKCWANLLISKLFVETLFYK